MPFEFRLCFHLLPEDRLDSTEPKLPLPGPANHLHLSAWNLGVPINDSPRISLVGRPYETLDQAAADGKRARHAVLLWALEQRRAIDLGDNHHRGSITASGKAWFAKELGGPVRKTLHGLDVYEQLQGQRFVNIEFTAALKIGVTSAIESIAHWYTANPQISEKQALAAELY